MMFEVWFKVPLYKGTLEPLRVPRLLNATRHRWSAQKWKKSMP